MLSLPLLTYQEHLKMNNHNPSLIHRTTSARLQTMLLLISVFHSAPPPYAAAQPPSEQTPVYPYGVQGSFNSSLTVILVVLFSCFFIFGFLSFYIHQCIYGTPAPAGHDLRQIVHNNRWRQHPWGLDHAVVDSFPVFPYSTVKHLKMGKGALECAVCISEFEEDDTLRLLPKCDHVFHQDCIDVWLASHTTCPVCRFDLTKKQPSSPVHSVKTRGSSESTHSTHEFEPPASQDVEVSSLQVSCNNGDQPLQIGARISRSHSMGHLLIQPGEDCERYTLRLPEEVKKRIVKFNRAKSTSGVVRNCGGEGGGGTDRWSLRMTPLFISRTISFGKGEGSTSSCSRAPV